MSRIGDRSSEWGKRDDLPRLLMALVALILVAVSADMMWARMPDIGERVKQARLIYDPIVWCGLASAVAIYGGRFENAKAGAVLLALGLLSGAAACLGFTVMASVAAGIETRAMGSLMTILAGLLAGGSTAIGIAYYSRRRVNLLEAQGLVDTSTGYVWQKPAWYHFVVGIFLTMSGMFLLVILFVENRDLAAGAMGMVAPGMAVLFGGPRDMREWALALGGGLIVGGVTLGGAFLAWQAIKHWGIEAKPNMLATVMAGMLPGILMLAVLLFRLARRFPANEPATGENV